MNDLSVITYNVTDAAIGELRSKYVGLKIVDIASYENVRVAIAEVREKRVGVEERRKELKASALEYGRKVDAEAKRITSLLLEIEDPLKAEKQKVDDEKARIKVEKERKEQERVAAIRARIFDMQKLVASLTGKTVPELQAISEQLFDMWIGKDVFQEFTAEADKVKSECLTIALKAREDRVIWEEQEEKRKSEDERLKKEREAQEAERKRLGEEKATLEAQKREQEIKERVERETKERLEREAKEKKEREETEAKERERKAAMAPDKEKLLAYADEMAGLLVIPSVTSKEANIILGDALRALNGIIAMVRNGANKL